MKHVVVCPTGLGCPMRRKRTYTFGIDRSRWVWVGSPTAQEIQSDFIEMFGRSLEIAGEVYARARPPQKHTFLRD